MGCDIHMVVERRTPRSWVTVNTMTGHHMRWPREGGGLDWSAPVATARNYRRFAMLAGVRGDGPPPRGLPDDISETAKFLSDDWGADGHSHSWIEADEAARIFLATEYDEVDPDSFKAKFPLSYFFGIETDDANEDDFRIVFWFDN